MFYAMFLLGVKKVKNNQQFVLQLVNCFRLHGYSQMVIGCLLSNKVLVDVESYSSQSITNICLGIIASCQMK